MALHHLGWYYLPPARLASVLEHLYLCRVPMRAWKDLSTSHHPCKPADELGPCLNGRVTFGEGGCFTLAL